MTAFVKSFLSALYPASARMALANTQKTFNKSHVYGVKV